MTSSWLQIVDLDLLTLGYPSPRPQKFEWHVWHCPLILNRWELSRNLLCSQYTGFRSYNHGWPSTQPGSLHTALQRKYTQPCSMFSRGTAMWTIWGHGCVNNEARLCASAQLCRGSPVISTTFQISGKRYVLIIVATLHPLYNGIYIITWSSYMSHWVLYTFWLLYESIMK